MQELIAKSKNGIAVEFDPINSHAATHLEDTPGLKKLVQEIVSKLELNGQEVGQSYDMGRIVGTCDVISVNENDNIVYGIRKNREDDGLVPFVKNRAGEPCSLVSVHLVPQSNNLYVLSSAWIGEFDDEPFPLSKDANNKSAEYWNRHAFVYGSQEMLADTETNACPW